MKRIIATGIVLSQSLVYAGWTAGSLNFDQKSEPHEIRATCSLSGIWKVSPVLKTHVRPDVQQAVQSKNYLPAMDVGKWRDITVPHYTWHQIFKNTVPDPAKIYSGYSFTDRQSTYTEGWFSKEFTVPATLKGNRIYLKFGSLAWESHIWVNGKKAGMHKGSFTGFKLDITDLVKFDKTNSLRIWVYNDFGEHPVRHPYGKMFFPLANVGGINGGVELEALPPVNISRCLISPQLKSSSVELDLQINNFTGKPGSYKTFIVLEGQLYGKKTGTVRLETGTVALNKESNAASLRFNLNSPELWSPAKPFLYNIYVTLKDAVSGKIAACYRDRFGFREFQIKGNKFFLNGERVRLYCGNIRTASTWETYSPDNQKSRDYMRRQKTSGANTIRYHMGGADSHRMLAMADEEGLFVISEFPMFHRVFHHLAFKNESARKIFMDNVLYEWKERLFRDYNHPACVVWSLSNEVWTDSTVDELNEIYSTMKPLDKQNRPMSTGSGLYSFGIPTLQVKTDLWDAHLYNLVSQIPYTFSKVDFDRYFKDLKEVYGKLDRPSAAFECLSLGAGRPPVKIPYNKNISVEKYLELFHKIKSVDVSYMGLRHFLDWRDNGSWLVDNISKKAVEEFRRETRIQGFHPWWNNRNRLFPAYKIITSPVFIGAEMLPKNQFSGTDFKFNAVFVKDPLREVKASCSAKIVDSNGRTVAASAFSAVLPENQDKTVCPVDMKLPDGMKTGFYKLELSFEGGSKLRNRNHYNIYILNQNDLPTLKCDDVIAVYQDSSVLSSILDKNKVKCKVIDNLNDLTNCKRLVVHIGNKKAWDKFAANGNAVRQWVKKGGNLLLMEVPEAVSLNWILSGYEIKKDDSGFETTSILMEPVVREHPVFNGLSVENFDTLNGDYGVVGNALLFPLSVNMLGAGYVSSKAKAGVMIFEAGIGKGSCLVSQVMALKRYNNDSSATLYLHNLLNYFGRNKKSSARTLQKITNFGVRAMLSGIKGAECVPLNLKKAVNRGLRDDVANDGKGGWTDSGQSDFRQAPVGSNQFMDIPYQIIDPAANSGNAAIILRGAKAPDLPARMSIDNINGKFRRLFFLNTSWYMKAGSKVMDYIINYSDGTRAVFPVMAGKDIGDWFAPSDLSNSAVAWSGKHPVIKAPFGYYITPWENPHPGKVIASIDIISGGNSVPIVLGVTGQRNIEFASETGHPWNFSSQNVVAKEVNLSAVKREKGLYVFKMTANHGWLGLNLFGNKINAKHWKRLKFALKSKTPVVVKVICFSPTGDNATCDRFEPAGNVDGWNYYDVDLENIKWRWGTSPEAKQWGGRDKTVVMLALDFTAKKGDVIQLRPVGLYKD